MRFDWHYIHSIYFIHNARSQICFALMNAYHFLSAHQIKGAKQPFKTDQKVIGDVAVE